MQASVQQAQQPLRARYREAPQDARVVDHARTCGAPAADPFHSLVEPMDGCGVRVPVGVHAGLGGPHDAPTPGDLLCAALAACQDSSVRMVANVLGVELEALAVRVTGTVDLRGTLGLDPQVPVGFQDLRCEVRLRARAGTPLPLLRKLQAAAERCCVVGQTLKAPPAVQTVFVEDRLDA